MPGLVSSPELRRRPIFSRPQRDVCTSPSRRLDLETASKQLRQIDFNSTQKTVIQLCQTTPNIPETEMLQAIASRVGHASELYSSSFYDKIFSFGAQQHDVTMVFSTRALFNLVKKVLSKNKTNKLLLF